MEEHQIHAWIERQKFRKTLGGKKISDFKSIVVSGLQLTHGLHSIDLTVGGSVHLEHVQFNCVTLKVLAKMVTAEKPVSGENGDSGKAQFW